jgi:hypothetical protein
LLGAFLSELPEVFAAEVLSRLSPTERTLLSWSSRDCREVVAASGLPRAGAGGRAGVPLRLVDFVGSIERLALARENGCPWGEET